MTFALVCLTFTLQSQTTTTVSNLWSIATSAGRSYVTSGNTERGVAYNPLNNHAYIVSRAGSLKVAIVDGDTGADLGTLSVSGITGGTFALSTISVADDGVIYAANLTTALATSPYKIYRWSTEASTPVLVYSGNPVGTSATRMGDSALDARGSGATTELISAPQNIATAVIFRPTDETLATFTSTRVDVTGVGTTDFNKAIVWGPTNTFFGKNSGNASARLCSYDLGLGTGALLATYTIDTVAAIDADPVRNLLAAADCSPNTNSTAHNLRVYNLASGTTPSSIFTSPFATPYTTNGNAVGQVQIKGDRIIAVDTQNGVKMAKIYQISGALPPSITQQPPTNTTILEGGYATISAAANGTAPLSYQWSHQDVAIPGATTNFLNLTNVSLSDTGRYNLLVTNVAGQVTSSNALVSVTPSVRSPVLTKCWELPPGSRSWITTDNNQRGLAYNPQTGHLLVVSRTPTNAIYIVDANDGAELGTLNVDPAIVTGGTFALNLIGVADDGSIYAANLTTGASGTPFKVYRWPFEDPIIGPSVAYSGDPANGNGGTTSVRWGDNMDVRGSASDIQILVASRAGNKAAVLTTADGGVSFLSSTLTTDAPDSSMGLGVAFGIGDTFWAKAPALALRQISFNLFNGSGTTLHTYGPNSFSSAMGPIAVDITYNYLAGITIETPDNLRLYNITDLNDNPLWVDTKFFSTDNVNGNGTGAADFGGGKLFALDSNNGIMAFTVQGPPTLVCNTNRTVECGSAWSFDEPTILDPCDGPHGTFVVSTVTNSLCGNTFSATRLWQLTNACGNRAQCSQTITVRDTQAPSITCGQDRTVDCGTAWTFDSPTASDTCGTVTVAVTSTATNSVVGGYAATRTWTATDACGNTAQCSQTVTVADTVAPSITCPGNISTPCTGPNGATVTFSATASDTCDPAPAVTCTPASGSTFSRGATTVNCTATDASGNHNSCSFTVTVVDNASAAMTIVQQGAVITISWPDTCTQYTLQETTSLDAPIGWSSSVATMQTSGGRKIATLVNAGGNKFFRLFSP